VIRDSKKKGRTPMEWTERETFKACKESLAEATLLTYSSADAALSLTTDASEMATGNCTQSNGEMQPLAFFSKKLSSTEIQPL